VGILARAPFHRVPNLHGAIGYNFLPDAGGCHWINLMLELSAPPQSHMLYGTQSDLAHGMVAENCFPS